MVPPVTRSRSIPPEAAVTSSKKRAPSPFNDPLPEKRSRTTTPLPKHHPAPGFRPSPIPEDASANLPLPDVNTPMPIPDEIFPSNASRSPTPSDFGQVDTDSSDESRPRLKIGTTSTMMVVGAKKPSGREISRPAAPSAQHSRRSSRDDSRPRLTQAALNSPRLSHGQRAGYGMQEGTRSVDSHSLDGIKDDIREIRQAIVKWDETMTITKAEMNTRNQTLLDLKERVSEYRESHLALGESVAAMQTDINRRFALLQQVMTERGVEVPALPPAIASVAHRPVLSSPLTAPALTPSSRAADAPAVTVRTRAPDDIFMAAFRRRHNGKR